MMGKVVSVHREDWHQHLAPVMVAYRAIVHEATCYSPNRLMFGREATLPIDLIYRIAAGHGTHRSPSHSSVDEHVNSMVIRATEDFTLVREKLRRLAEARKVRYDLKVKTQEFNPG